jgi:hypothetical protein
MAVTKNVVQLRAAYDALAQRDHGVEGMGLVFGLTGAGKSTSIAWLRDKCDGVYVRAVRAWTLHTMLGAIIAELGATPAGSRGSAKLVYQIVELLAKNGKPLFVDELDYLMGNRYELAMLESLRDIYDLSKSPVVLIGMKGVEKRIVNHQQIARRITQPVEFLPADAEDARTLTDTVCEVEVKDDLLADLHRAAEGNVGLMVNGLSKFEALSKANGWRSIDRERWGNRPFFLSGPSNGGKRK